MSNETIVLAGGCFWGMQDLYRRQPGVISTRVGYSGGTTVVEGILDATGTAVGTGPLTTEDGGRLVTGVSSVATLRSGRFQAAGHLH